MTDLASVIRQIESSGNSHALRFEPGVYSWDTSIFNREATVKEIALVNGCSLGTAHVIFSTSYGLYQEMGFNLWDAMRPLIRVDEFTFRADTGLQDKAFTDFLVMHGISYTLDEIMADPAKMRKFVITWNGPGDIDDYVAKIKKYAAAPST